MRGGGRGRGREGERESERGRGRERDHTNKDNKGHTKSSHWYLHWLNKYNKKNCRYMCMGIEAEPSRLFQTIKYYLVLEVCQNGGGRSG